MICSNLLRVNHICRCLVRKHRRNKRQVDGRSTMTHDSSIWLFRPLLESLQCHFVLAEIDAMIFLEFSMIHP